MVTTRYFGQRDEFSEEPEVFTYDDLPQDLRYKVVYALEDLIVFFAKNMSYGNADLPVRLWNHLIVRVLGLPKPPSDIRDFLVPSGVREFFIGVEVALDAITRSFADLDVRRDECRERLLHTVDSINKLFLYYALGYEIVPVKEMPPFQVIRKDTQFTHAGMTKPALLLLADEEFAHAEKQFRDAHREFQEGNHADAVTDASATVESVLKVVLGVDEGNPKDLLNRAADEGYFPSFMESSSGQWANLFLELPSIRHRLGDAHGKDKPPDTSELERYARLALNLAASHILFIVNEYRRRRTAE